MTRVSVFSSPLLLGFEHIERVLDRANKTAAEGYPPYNIEQTGEHRLRITLAVAGFGDDDLSVNVEDNQLVVRGKQQEDTANRIYLHRGIASRQFTRSFVLAEGIEVRGCSDCKRSASYRFGAPCATAQSNCGANQESQWQGEAG